MMIFPDFRFGSAKVSQFTVYIMVSLAVGVKCKTDSTDLAITYEPHLKKTILASESSGAHIL